MALFTYYYVSGPEKDKYTNGKPADKPSMMKVKALKVLNLGVFIAGSITMMKQAVLVVVMSTRKKVLVP